MKFTVAASVALLAGCAIAAPNTAFRRQRHAAHRSRPLNRISTPADHGKTNNKNVDYSSNWSGAVLVGGPYQIVTGEFQVPEITTPGSGSAWVGIDGDTCQSAILQAGIDWTASTTGSVSYAAWFEWFPDYAYNFPNFPIEMGDLIKVTVNATGPESGIAKIRNVKKNIVRTHKFTAQTEGALCYQNAEWIVEDYESDGSQVPFADYGAVYFNSCFASAQGGQAVDTTGADIIDMEQNGQVISTCSASAATVTCQYQ